LRGMHSLSQWMATVIDQQVVDHLVNRSGSLVFMCSRFMRRLNNGLIPPYALMLFLGATFIVVYLLLLV